ncbi:hypothetical protein CIRG_06190 [Coccidioides immitis RMSCC 2394]|uniref:Uncharacterized protein n=1 Tax=Coccidioides immitis RMSCC 2394 TaxID=404692 RepID=A0A0J6YHH3_COCIT|nr:hypothetical protein CIRG_06190 [Coccidioides immitis RMSCC 2394]
MARQCYLKRHLARDMKPMLEHILRRCLSHLLLGTRIGFRRINTLSEPWFGQQIWTLPGIVYLTLSSVSSIESRIFRSSTTTLSDDASLGYQHLHFSAKYLKTSHVHIGQVKRCLLWHILLRIQSQSFGSFVEGAVVIVAREGKFIGGKRAVQRGAWDVSRALPKNRK